MVEGMLVELIYY